MSEALPGAAGPPPGFPRVGSFPVRTDALSWFNLKSDTAELNRLQFEARDEVVPLWYAHPTESGLIGVPRTLAPFPQDDAQDHRAVGEFTFDAEFTSDLRPEQVPFVTGVFRMLEDEFGGIGEAPTGFGKTTTGCALIARIGRPTCVVVPKSDLDWTDEIVKHTSIPREKVHEWRGKKVPPEDAWVVVASLQSIHRIGEYPPHIYRRFACVIFDEVHKLGAPEFSNAVRLFPSMFRLGLSATPDRRDRKMPLVRAHLGWRTIHGSTDATPPNYFTITSPWTEPRKADGTLLPFRPDRTGPAKKSLMMDSTRNGLIAAAAWRAHKAGRRTIVFIEQKKHGEMLRQIFTGMGIPSYSVVPYNGESTADEKERARACAEGIVMIATYKFTAEGTNIPALDTAIIAHPIYDPTQPVGRILRKHPGKPVPVVLDVVDPSSGVLRRLAQARWKYLHKIGAVWKGEWA